MNVNVIHDKVTQLCISGILRCFRTNVITGSNFSNYAYANSINLEMLRFYWALSSGIEEVARIVVHNSRRLTTAITYEEVELLGEITGSLNAGATMLLQARTLNPALFVVSEPNTTFHSEPNHLVAWTLFEAFNILLSAQRKYKQLSKLEWFNKKISILEQALRNEILHEILLTPVGRKRPNGSVIRAASKARVPIYKKAIEAYNLLEGIERGQEVDIISCLSQTLIANLEYWQRLELATAIGAANELSASTGVAVKLSFPFMPGRPIASVGRFDVYWQYSISQRSRDQLDLTELWSRQIATNIGVKSSDSRADVVICYDHNVISLIECKYFESESSLSQAVLDASNQIVRYARDLHPESIPKAKHLLSQSCIIVASCGSYCDILNPLEPSGQTFEKRFIYFTDIDGIFSNSLKNWSEQLSACYSATSEVLEG